MATYFVCSGAAGTNTGASWVNAHVSIPGLMTAQAVVGGDIIYVHNTHAFLAGANVVWTLPETGEGTVQVLCVDGGDAAFTSAGASMGTTVGALTTGAVENTNGNFSFSVRTASSAAAKLIVHGVDIKTGGGSTTESSADIGIGYSANGVIELSALTLWTNTSNTGAQIVIGNIAGGTASMRLSFRDVAFRFGAVGQTMLHHSGMVEMWNSTIHASGSAPTTFLSFSGSRWGTLSCHSCDWSRATNAITQASAGVFLVSMNNCTIATPVTGTHSGVAGIVSEFHACAAVDGTNGANVLQYYKEDVFGVVQDDQTVYVTTGPAQGTQDDGTATSYSLKMTPSALALVYQPLYTPWVWAKVAATGSKAISMKVADTEGALLKDAELWMEVEYMGGAAPANSPQSALEGSYPLVGTYHDVTAAGSDLTDSAEAWTGITETGTYTLSKTVTLDEQGYIRCRVGLGKDTTNPVYVDPKISVA